MMNLIQQNFHEQIQKKIIAYESLETVTLQKKLESIAKDMQIIIAEYMITTGDLALEKAAEYTGLSCYEIKDLYREYWRNFEREELV